MPLKLPVAVIAMFAILLASVAQFLNTTCGDALTQCCCKQYQTVPLESVQPETISADTDCGCSVSASVDDYNTVTKTTVSPQATGFVPTAFSPAAGGKVEMEPTQLVATTARGPPTPIYIEVCSLLI